MPKLGFCMRHLSTRVFNKRKRVAATEGDESRRLRVVGWIPHPFYLKTDFRYLFDWRELPRSNGRVEGWTHI